MARNHRGSARNEKGSDTEHRLQLRVEMEANIWII